MRLGDSTSSPRLSAFCVRPSVKDGESKLAVSNDADKTGLAPCEQFLAEGWPQSFVAE
jgi:hypothetical protein